MSEDITQEEQLKNAIFEAGERAKSESGMISSQAQRLFYEYWNNQGDECNLKDAVTHFKKCMQMAEQMMDILREDFSMRVKKYDDGIKKKYEKSGLILPGASEWESWRPNMKLAGQ